MVGPRRLEKDDPIVRMIVKQATVMPKSARLVEPTPMSYLRTPTDERDCVRMRPLPAPLPVIVERDVRNADVRELYREIEFRTARAEEEAARGRRIHRIGAFANGVVQGLSGYESPTTQEGYELEHAVGLVAGAGVGLVTDAHAIGSALATTVGGAGACATGIGCLAASPAIAASGVVASAAALAASQIHGPQVMDGLREINQWHHIIPNKNHTAGGAWTPRMEPVFGRAKATLNDDFNIMWVDDHGGPHGEIYNRTVCEAVLNAVRGKKGQAYMDALRAEVARLRTIIHDPNCGLAKNDLERSLHELVKKRGKR